MSKDSVAPDNFSWVVPGKVAALAFPHSERHLRYLTDVENISLLISLTRERLPPVHLVPQLEVKHIDIKDFTPPTIKQIEEFLQIVENYNSDGKSVAVHCAHGNGRTGTLLACYFVFHKGITGEEGIRKIRELRPRSIETLEQEECVRKFYRYLDWERNRNEGTKKT